MQTKAKGLVIGIALSAEGVSLCVLQKSKQGQIEWIKDATFGLQDWTEELQNFAKVNKLLGSDCYVNLTSHHYQLLQIDKPNVPDEDMHSALVWTIKELISNDTEYAHDYAQQPIQVGGQDKLSVVAIPKKDIQQISSTIYAAGLKLRAIGIEELSSALLSPMVDEAVLTLVQEHTEEIVLNIVRNRQLYFSRRIKGFENLGGFSEQELEMGIVDNLCVQIQRSMDFFESQLRQPPVRKILTKLDTPLQKQLVQQIQEAMDISVELFEPDIVLNEGFNFKMASFSCLGAAYQAFTNPSKVKNIANDSSKGAI